MLETIASGIWLTADRRRGYGWICIVLMVAGMTWLLATSNGLVAWDGKPLGTDFSNVYAAGRMTLRGDAANAYDWSLEHAEEQSIFGRPDIPFYGWHYPPFFLLLAAGLAALPYLAALAVWQVSTFILYLRTAYAIIPSREMLFLAAASPVVFVNVGHGHNGFLTVSLLAGALILLDRRPVVAGILIGLLAYKPQFGLLIPLVLMATGRWRTFMAAAATVISMVLLVTAVLGIDVWLSFYASLALTKSIVLEAGSTGWEKIQSIFSAVRMWGGSIPLAHVLQTLFTIIIAMWTVRLWRRPVAFDVKASALCSATLLATPYVLDYDMVVLGAAVAFLVRNGMRSGFARYEISLLAAAWLVPLLARTIASYTMVPIGLMVTTLLFAAAVRHDGSRGSITRSEPASVGP
ncbi:glycosyltransferase family 87 protein [Rhizobium sp. PAMB 3174]